MAWHRGNGFSSFVHVRTCHIYPSLHRTNSNQAINTFTGTYRIMAMWTCPYTIVSWVSQLSKGNWPVQAIGVYFTFKINNPIQNDKFQFWFWGPNLINFHLRVAFSNDSSIKLLCFDYSSVVQLCNFSAVTTLALSLPNPHTIVSFHLFCFAIWRQVSKNVTFKGNSQVLEESSNSLWQNLLATVPHYYPYVSNRKSEPFFSGSPIEFRGDIIKHRLCFNMCILRKTTNILIVVFFVLVLYIT